MSEQDFPFISDALMKALDERFPEASPSVSATEREIWIAVGRRDLVRFLKQKHKSQLEKSTHVLQQRS